MVLSLLVDRSGVYIRVPYYAYIHALWFDLFPEFTTTLPPEDISKRWPNGIEQAIDTLNRMTQPLIQYSVMPLEHTYQSNSVFQKNWLCGIWEYDTMDSQKSLDRNRYDKIFSNGSLLA